MKLAITFHQMDATDAVKSYTTEKLGKLERFVRQPLHGHATVSCQKRIHTIEISLQSGGIHFHAKDSSEDMYASIDKVSDKLERQIRESKGSVKGAERSSSRLSAQAPSSSSLLEDAAEE